MAALELLNTTLFSDANLQAYYRLEGNANDSKNSNNLTSTGSPGTVAGQFGNALDYESTTPSYSNGALTAPTGSFTILAWVKFESLTALDAIAVFGNVGGTDYTGVLVGTGANVIRFAMNGASEIESDVTVTTATWYMVGVVWDGTNKKVIVNDTIKSAVDATTPSTTGTFGIASLGAYVGSAWGDSVIDDVAYFDRALTDTEITDHYNGSDGLGGGLDLTSKYW